MRIVDLALNPFVIDVVESGFVLIKLGIRQEGKDKGKKTETVEGHYSKGGLKTVISKIVHSKLVDTGGVKTLQQFLKEYHDECEVINKKLDKILNL